MSGELPFDAWRREQGYQTPAGRELAQYDASFDAWIVAETALTFEEWVEAKANPPKPTFPALRNIPEGAMKMRIDTGSLRAWIPEGTTHFRIGWHDG